MKKALFFGLMAAALGFTACSDENDSIFNENTSNGMILNATVNGGIDTRAAITEKTSPAAWPFSFVDGDVVQVSNEDGPATYTFTKSSTYFTCDDATPTDAPSIWHAYYPVGDIALTGQTGTLASVAAKYALSGSTATPTTGSPSLSIDLEGKVAILKIKNVGGGSIDINIKNSADTWVTGLTEGVFNLITSDSKQSILTTSSADPQYVVVPAGVQLVIKDENTVIGTTTSSGFEAGKYYTITTGVAPWETRLTKGHSTATKIEIQTGIQKKPSDAADLNAEGSLWETLSADGKTLYIQTPCKKILGHDSFPHPTWPAPAKRGLYGGYTEVTEISGLDKVDMSGVEDFESMFHQCHKLTTLDVTSMNTASATNMSSMFAECEALPTVNLDNFDTSNVTDMSGMFWMCYGMTTLDVTHFNTANVTNMSCMFLCPSLTTLDVTHFNTANVTDMSDMFCSCASLTTLDVTHFNTANVTDMYGMFGGCSSLTTLDVSSFNTANVTNMSSMFSGCKKLTSIVFNTTNFNTANVTDMSNMFYQCEEIPALDLSHFNTANVTGMSSMFNMCYKLASLNLSSFNTANVTDMAAMFSWCKELTSLPLPSNFKTDKVTDMSWMFDECFKLTSLDLSLFNTNMVTTFENMFYGDSKLEFIKLSDNFVINSTADKQGMMYAWNGRDSSSKLTVYVNSSDIRAALKENDEGDETKHTGWTDVYMQFATNP